MLCGLEAFCFQVQLYLSNDLQDLWTLLATTVFLGESCDRRQRAARNFEKDIGLDGLEFTTASSAARVTSCHFIVKFHSTWVENRQIPWRFVPGSSPHVAATNQSPRRSRHFIKARVPYKSSHGWWAGKPTHTHTHILNRSNLLFFSGSSCWCFGIHPYPVT